MMKRVFTAVGAATVALCLAFPAAAQTKLRVGWCAKTYNVSMAPFAVAQKKGWLKDNNIDMELLSFAGSIDCMRSLATHDVALALAAPEPLAILSLQGVKARVFFEAYRRNIFGLAVKADSDIHSYKDLKGETIGVLSMGSVGVQLAKSLTKSAGLNPDTDIRIVVTGEPAQTAALVRRGEVKVLSQFDTYYTLIERAGVKLRRLEDDTTTLFPSNSWVALDETIKDRREDLVNFTRAYAMATAYTIAHPREAIKIAYEVYPQIRPSNMELEDAVTYDLAVLNDRIRTWSLNNPGKDKWGEVNVEAYQKYMDWLNEAGILKGAVDAKNITTNELISDINTFDHKLIEAP